AFQKQQLDGYALDSYQQALNLAPNSAEVNKQMGFYYLSKGDKTRAKEHFIASYRSDNGQPDVAHELGRLGVELRIRSETVANTEEPDNTVQ
ncbi:MAG: tetratricopeptide repeat protein, partial [Planctomycetota bacterium]